MWLTKIIQKVKNRKIEDNHIQIINLTTLKTNYHELQADLENTLNDLFVEQKKHDPAYIRRTQSLAFKLNPKPIPRPIKINIYPGTLIQYDKNGQNH